MDSFTFVLLGGYIVLGAVVVAVYSLRRYEMAILIMAMSPLLSTIFIANTGDMQEGLESNLGPYLRVSVVLFVGILGGLRYLRTRAKDPLPFHFVLLAVFVLIAFASAAYSIDPRVTLIRAISTVSVFAFLLGLHYWLTDQDRLNVLMDTLFVQVILCTAISVISIVALPGKAWMYPDMSRFQGLFGHPNVMGGFCMLSYPVLLWKYHRSQDIQKWIVVAFTVMVLFLHLLTGSRGSLLPAALMIVIWFVALRQWGRAIALTAVLVLLAVAATLVFNSRFERDENTGLSGLTGRPEFWQASYQLIMERPLLGYGYAVEGKVWEDPRFNNKELYLWSGSARTSLHNGYLSIAIGGGIFS